MADNLLLQQQKLAGIAQGQQMAQQRTPGQVAGETPEQFAAGKQNPNLFRNYQTPKPAPQSTAQAVPPRNTNNPVQPAVTYQPPIDPSNPASGMNALAQMYTSPEDEERMRRASMANRRILAFADAARHIGNIIHTVNYAPPQQFNSPVLEEEQRYERGKALRDAANLKYSAYQQAKAAQDAKQRQWEADYGLKVADAARKAGYTEAQIKNMQDRLAQQKAYQQGQLDLGNRRADDAKALGEARLKQQTSYQNTMAGIADRNARTNERRAAAYINRLNGGGGGSGKVERRDTRRGYLTKKGATAGEIKNTYHQMYEWGKKMKDPRTGRPYIDEAELKGQMNYGGFSIGGSAAISQNIKERAVDKMLMEHDDAAVRMHSKYGWQWNEQIPNDKTKGDPFADRNKPAQTKTNHKEDPFS